MYYDEIKGMTGPVDKNRRILMTASGHPGAVVRVKYGFLVQE